MDDTSRLRTKLRLDLNDVSNQIAELDERLENEKRPEDIEQRQKLIEYEKKLKDQYERMTGLTFDQVTTISTRKKPKVEQPSQFARILGIITGFFLLGGYYNLALYGIGKYTIFDFFAYLSGGGDLILLPKVISNLENSFIIVAVTLGVPIVTTFIRSIASKSRSDAKSASESLALVLPTFYIVFSASIPNFEQALVNNQLTLLGIFVSSAALYFISTLDGSKAHKITGGIVSAIYLYVAYLAYISAIASDTELFIAYNWVFTMFALMMIVLISGLSYLFGIIKD